MAKTPKPKPIALGTQSREETGPAIPSPVPLTVEERVELREIFNKPAYRKAFTNARLKKPSAFAPQDALNGEHGGQVANNRLHQIQGWEMFEVALAIQALDPLPPKKQVEESYPPDPFFASADPNFKPEPAKPTNPKKP